MVGIDREMLDTFIEESTVRLARIASALEQLALDQPLQMEVVHDLFREIHSLKGAANLVGIKPVEQLAHKLEDILEQIRNGTQYVDAELVDILNLGYQRIGELLKTPQILPLIDVKREIDSIERLLGARLSR